MRVRIEASELPGGKDVYVGVQRKQEVVEQMRADSPSAAWSFDVEVRQADDGTLDFRGPFVHGKRGDRFLYLSWGAAGDDGEITMFRRLKLHFEDIDAEVLRRGAAGAGLVARLGLTDEKGEPRCARTRPPVVSWSAA